MDDLITFLRAQLDEDERVARAATRYWHGVTVESATKAEEVHAFRHGPARVLAEVEAKRALIEETIRPWLGNDQATGRIAWTALRLLALPYVDRDGYREEWRP